METVSFLEKVRLELQSFSEGGEEVSLEVKNKFEMLPMEIISSLIFRHLDYKTLFTCS